MTQVAAAAENDEQTVGLWAAAANNGACCSFSYNQQAMLADICFVKMAGFDVRDGRCRFPCTNESG